MVSYLCFELISLFSLFTPVTFSLAFPGPKPLCSSAGQIIPSVAVGLSLLSSFTIRLSAYHLSEMC